MLLWKKLFLIMMLASLPVSILIKAYFGFTPIAMFFIWILWNAGVTYWAVFRAESIWSFFCCWTTGSVFLRLLSPLINKIELDVRQAFRNARAEQIGNGESGAFVLFLRPFAVDDKLGLLGVSAKWGGADLESLIGYASKPVGSLIAFGREDDCFGAGRLEAGEEGWYYKFISLANRARLIVVIPSANKGTADEIRWIIGDSALEKTIFVMPPTTQLNFLEHEHSAGNTRTYADQWKDATKVYLASDLDLPPYNENGALFMIDHDRRVADLLNLRSGTLMSRWAMRRYFVRARKRYTRDLIE